jgi:formamidopyrimidine-DNA glycosylase
VILNQEIMSGVGNIYADESLWRAKIHPETPACDLTTKKIGTLIDAATEVMAEAIKAGGTSFDSLYINVNGESGFFETSLAAYGQEHQPCPRCGREIRRIAFGGRSSHFCPKCQTK